MKSKFLYIALILSIITFAFAASVFADTGKKAEIKVVETKHRLNPDADEFIFALDTYQSEDGTGTFYTKTITVRDAGGKTIQKIEIADFNNGEDASSFLDPDERMLFDDLNFDGWDDMGIVAYSPPGPNTPYIIWLWDAGKKQFIYNEALSRLTAIQVDKDAKIIKSSNRSSAVEYHEDYFKYIGGKLTLFKSIETLYSGKGTMEVMTSELINGKMVKTGRVKKKSENDADSH
jgi:hypothetical protein